VKNWDIEKILYKKYNIFLPESIVIHFLPLSFADKRKWPKKIAAPRRGGFLES
jgi:hypothetical protein